MWISTIFSALQIVSVWPYHKLLPTKRHTKKLCNKQHLLITAPFFMTFQYTSYVKHKQEINVRNSLTDICAADRTNKVLLCKIGHLGCEAVQSGIRLPKFQSNLIKVAEEGSSFS
jgi:hypothetical protein